MDPKEYQLEYNPVEMVLSLTFLNVLSILSNFLASSGNCALISPPIKMLSKYIHFL